MKDMVSIVVPMHNAKLYIEDTIKSVLAQTYEAWELILVDDCSTDETLLVVEKLVESLSQQQKERIRVLPLAENIGAANTRNAGTKKAKGRYLCFLDADDLWREDKLEKQILFMQEKGATFSFTSYEFGDANAAGTGKVVHVPDQIVYKQALQNTTIFTSTVMFDIPEFGLEQLMMPDIKSEDSALWFKLLRRGLVAYGLDENLVTYRRPANSLSSNKVEAIRRIWNLYRKAEGLSFLYSAYNLLFWAWRAVRRRI